MLRHLSGALDSTVARLPVRPAAYFFMFLGWTVTLWFLSAGNVAPKHGPDIPHIDKVAHFLYFLGGGALLATYGGLKWPELSSKKLFLWVALSCCVIGRLDEYHQGFTPGRSGNDTGDWIADTLGGVSGGLLVVWLLLPRMSGIRLNEGGNSRQKPA